MKIIIFAGGTGKRFWPVSRKNSPKQFSPLISGKPLLLTRIESLLKKFKPEDLFISTGKKFQKEVYKIAKDIPKQNIILEPEMRDTGPAVTLAVTYVNKLYPNEAVSIQWSDQIVKDENTLFKTLNRSEKLLNKKTKVVFIAVPARFASPYRGYIKFKNTGKELEENIKLHNFIEFKEKPTIETALEYIKSGNYGWNPGYWTINSGFYLNKLSKFSPKVYNICKEIVESNFSEGSLIKFSELDKISVDYMFAENIKSNEAVVLQADFGWSDVGEWISLKEALQESEKSNVIKGNVFDLDSTDSIIFNLEESKLVSTIGLKGMVVVNTKDVIAVFRKEDNNRLKEYLEKLESELGDGWL